jgi:uncharacterized protein (TIGR02996 family)
MFSVVVRSPDVPAKTHAFEGLEISIGSAQGNHLVIGDASARHARVVVKDGRFIVVDLKSEHGTYLNGKRLTSPVVVREQDQIAIGEYMLQLQHAPLEPLPVLDGTEAAFLASIEARPQNDEERLVYCDWLEEHGFLDRAEFLRIQISLRAYDDRTVTEPAVLGASERLRILSTSIDLRWRAIVARPALENCDVRFELRCPKRWDQLTATAVDTVRHCQACERQVTYCTSIFDARRLAQNGACVAVDASVPRRAHDLEQQPMLGMIAPRK